MATRGTEVLVLGGGPAGVFAALRAADLGASTTLLTSGELGGMAATDGPVPVRTLAHAARMMRDVGQLGVYGIRTSEPALDYSTLLSRVSDVVSSVQSHSTLRSELERAGTVIHENAGPCRFLGSHTVETASGQKFPAEKIIICVGGKVRRLTVPGAEYVASHSDAWSLESVPRSMLVIGGGATGLQVASIFAAFGTRVELFESANRLLPKEDEDVGAAVAEGFRNRGIVIRQGFGLVNGFERAGGGIRMHFSDAEGEHVAEAELAVSAVGWSVDAEQLALSAAGVETDDRGYIRVDEHGQTSAPGIYAAGDVTGVAMLAPQAMQQGYIAASAALGFPELATAKQIVPVGSFTDPEYARVGMTEGDARKSAYAISVSVPFGASTRPIIDGRTFGFCKLIADRSSRQILGCSVVGERAVDIVQVAAVAMAADMRVDRLAYFPLSFPTYAGVLSQAAARLTYRLNRSD
jgi:dihydrolipoamide dehydrogenase